MTEGEGYWGCWGRAFWRWERLESPNIQVRYEFRSLPLRENAQEEPSCEWRWNRSTILHLAPKPPSTHTVPCKSPRFQVIRGCLWFPIFWTWVHRWWAIFPRCSTLTSRFFYHLAVGKTNRVLCWGIPAQSFPLLLLRRSRTCSWCTGFRSWTWNSSTVWLASVWRWTLWVGGGGSSTYRLSSSWNRRRPPCSWICELAPLCWLGGPRYIIEYSLLLGNSCSCTLTRHAGLVFRWEAATLRCSRCLDSIAILLFAVRCSIPGSKWRALGLPLQNTYWSQRWTHRLVTPQCCFGSIWGYSTVFRSRAVQVIEDEW